MTYITFDLFHDDSPLLVRLDFQRPSVVKFIPAPPIIYVGHPIDDQRRNSPIYITVNNPLQRRAHLDVWLMTSHALLASAASVGSPFSRVKRLHHFSHKLIPDIIRLTERAALGAAERSTDI